MGFRWTPISATSKIPRSHVGRSIQIRLMRPCLHQRRAEDSTPGVEGQPLAIPSPFWQRSPTWATRVLWMWGEHPEGGTGFPAVAGARGGAELGPARKPCGAARGGSRAWDGWSMMEPTGVGQAERMGLSRILDEKGAKLYASSRSVIRSFRSSNKDAIRWRPSQVGWRPSLLETKGIAAS